MSSGHFSAHVDVITSFASAAFEVLRPRSEGLVVLGEQTLSISTPKSNWPIAYAYDNWCDWLKTRQEVPAFEWESVAAFRNSDPILILHQAASVEALMQIKEDFAVPCPLGARNRLTYVSFLEVAPWNRTTSKGRRFKGIGALMLRFAAQRSRQLGFEGRLGLHSLHTAEAFYRQLGFVEVDCPNEYHELYLELSADAAGALLEERRSP
jgi:GNAT superfamily N-acetyltransferase